MTRGDTSDEEREDMPLRGAACPSGSHETRTRRAGRFSAELCSEDYSTRIRVIIPES